MTYYTKDGAIPKPLPFRIRLSDGRTRTKSESFTAAEIADAGFVAADPKPAPGINQEVTWGGSDWVLRDKTPEELAAELGGIRSSLEASLNARYESAMKLITNGYHRIEREGWPHQIEAAKVVIAGGTHSLITHLSATKGRTDLEMATRILQLEAASITVYQVLTPNFHRLQNLIRDPLATLADLEAIDVTAGWTFPPA